MSQLPSRLIAVDVETTGLHSNDRIVTLGAWRIDSANLSDPKTHLEYIHLICDPGKKSHPRAEEVHGYSDWVLRHQEPFSTNAKTVFDFLNAGDVIIAHNASFDMSFIEREFRAAGMEAPKCPSYCTMNGYRSSGLGGRASLNAICGEMGLRRIDKKHGALEDSWLAMMVYFRLHKIKNVQPFSFLVEKGLVMKPSNFVEPPVLLGPIPTRRQMAAEVARKNRQILESKDQLMKVVRPTALLLLEVARAGKTLSSEKSDILTSVIRSASERLSLKIDDETEQDILAELFDIDVSQNILTRSARALCENPAARAEFPKLLASIAALDGVLSPAEREAVDRVKAAIRRVLPQ